MTTSDAPGPLSGLLVADFSRILAGPYCTMLLGDLGADVVKVESTDGDDTRRWVPPARGELSTYYLAVNRNKRSIALDFAVPEDGELARELASRADVVVQNFRPGSLDRFGLDHASVSAGNPSVVYASITGFGSGAGAALPGYDIVVQAMSGLMTLTGAPDGPPYRAGISVFDVMAGLHATTGILAALHARRETGRGQHVEVDLMSSALSGMVNQSSAYVAGDAVPWRMGNAHPSLFPYEPFAASDGDVVVTAVNDAQFRKLCAVLGAPELADDPRFATTADRTARRDQLRPLLAERVRLRPRADWFTLLTRAGLPCGPVHDVAQGVAFATSIGLDPVVPAGTGPDAVPTVRHPVRFSETPARYDLPPPALDEHGAQLRVWLRERTGEPGATTTDDRTPPTGAATRTLEEDPCHD